MVAVKFSLFREIFNFVFFEIFLQFREINNYFEIILIFAKFKENYAKHKIKNFVKILWNYKNQLSQQPYAGLEWGGEAGQYSPSASSALTQIVPYSASHYTVFHSVIYNSVGCKVVWLDSYFTLYGTIRRYAVLLYLDILGATFTRISFADMAVTWRGETADSTWSSAVEWRQRAADFTWLSVDTWRQETAASFSWWSLSITWLLTGSSISSETK